MNIGTGIAKYDCPMAEARERVPGSGARGEAGADQPSKRTAIDESKPDEPGSAAEDAALPAPPRIDHRRFRRELMPAWLGAVAVLRGEPIQRLGRPDLHVAYLGGGHTVTHAVAAAVQPDASVWVWDHRPAAVELTGYLADAASLPNLVVHEHPELPSRLGALGPIGGPPRPVDLVVVDQVLDSFGDEGRTQVIAAIEESLRPGGAVVVTYRTAVGWAEVDPLVRLLRYMVAHQSGPLLDATDQAVAQLVRLRDAGAVYLHARPLTLAWLDDLTAMPTTQVVADYLDQDLRPISHVQVSDALGAIGCHFIGSATFDDDAAWASDELPMSDPLIETVTGAPSVELRETFADLALRRTIRTDLFRLGHPIASRVPFPLSLAPLDTRDRDLLKGADQTAMAVLMAQGRAHPAASGPPDQRAIDASARLTEVLAKLDSGLASQVSRLQVLPQFLTAGELPASGTDQPEEATS